MATTSNFEFFTAKADYFLSQGKGFSLFNSNQNDWSHFIEICQAKHIATSIIHCSRFEPETTNLNSDNTVAIIIQDLDLQKFQSKGAIFADKLFFPLWFNGRPVCFFSVLDKSFYKHKNISSGDIHTNYQAVVNFLLVEQINALLEFNNIQFSSPEFLALTPDKTIFTPIEQMLANELEKAKLSFVPQVHIGRYFVDFLVTIDNQKIIVECDGREYHDPVRDRERDEVLALENYPIIRFSGSEIYCDSAQCVEKIKLAARKQSRPNLKVDEDIDPDQSRAIGFITGPVRVLAPAGSGKTKTLTNRIANLINHRIPQEKILALAFNKKAQEEMQNRLYSKHITEVSVRTFHSLGMEIIQQSLKWEFQGKNEKKVTRELLKSAVEETVQLPRRRNMDPLGEFLDALARAKMELIPLASMEVEIEDTLIPFETIFYSYLKKQTSHNFFNFDDMIYLAVRILLNNDQIRQEYQMKFEYILVDEFQDLNKAQLLFLQILSLPQNNVYVVGDDDQIIYGWRGAEVRQIIEFHKRFSIIQECILSTNYRSSQEIVRHSRWLIDHNTDRVPKDIHARASAKEGLFEIHGNKNLWEQCLSAAEWISNLKVDGNQKWKDFAVLFRYNAFEYPIAMALDKCNIPHSAVDNVKLFQSRVGADILAYLSVILYPEDAKKEEYSRILSRPNKYFTNEIISKAKNWMTLVTLSNNEDLRGWEKEKVTDFISRIEILRNRAISGANPGEMVSSIATEFELEEFYLDQSKKNEDLDTASDDMLLDVIQAISLNFKDTNSFYQALNLAALDDGELEKNEDSKRDEILLSTIHKSKGKEFENVVLLNLSQEKRKRTAADIEEERRVAYVAITRPKNSLLVTFIASQHSSFVKEMALNPAFDQKTNVDLCEKESTLKFEIIKVENDLKIKSQKKMELEARFPELLGGDLHAAHSYNLWNRLKLWIYQKKLGKAFQQYKLIGEQIFTLGREQLKPKLEDLNQIQSELNFRKALGQEVVPVKINTGPYNPSPPSNVRETDPNKIDRETSAEVKSSIPHGSKKEGYLIQGYQETCECVFCHRMTNDWWWYDGKMNTCRCRDCMHEGKS